MADEKIELFCDRIKERLGAAECMSFSGRVEGITALFDAIQLGNKDCVYLSALSPGYIVRAILACGAVPVFCDVTADGFVLDHRALAEAVRQTVNEDKLYPRAVVADHFMGMPCSMSAILDLCDRMGLILIENCGNGFGCAWDRTECGHFGDYSLISLGISSVFGTGGSGCLAVANGRNELAGLIGNCDGSGWDPIDGIYADRLLASLDTIPDRFAQAEAMLDVIREAVSESDFWLCRGGGKQKSSCSGTVVVARTEKLCEAALDMFAAAGLSDYIRKVHVHHRACFERGCRGYKTLENAPALAPRAFTIDIYGALNSGKAEDVKKCINFITSNIHS